MFVCLTLLGTLTLLTRRETLESLSILSATWIFGFVGLGSIVLGLSGLLGYRWILSFEIFAPPMAGMGLLWIARSIRSERVSAGLVGLIVTAVVFASITTPLANYDTNIYSPHTFLRLEFSESELVSLAAISSEAPNEVFTLSPESGYFAYYAGISEADVGTYLVNRQLGDIPPGLVVLRTSSSNGPIYFTSTLIALSYDPVSAMEAVYDKTYDSGSVVAFAT